MVLMLRPFNRYGRCGLFVGRRERRCGKSLAGHVAGARGRPLTPAAMLAVGIEAVVGLADSEQVAVLPRELVRCRFPLSDGGITHPGCCEWRRMRLLP